MNSLFEILKFCTELTGEDAKKRNADPLKALTISLHTRICESEKFQEGYQEEYQRHLAEVDCDKENFAEAVKSHDDARILYARLVTFVLHKLADALVQKGEDYLISMSNLNSFEKALQFYIPAAVLPYLEQGVGAPLEKRSSLVKFWQKVEEPAMCRQRLREAMECLLRLGEANKSLLFILNSKLLPDVIAANEQLLHLEDDSLLQRYETFIYEAVHRSHLMEKFLTLIEGFGVGDRRFPAPQWLRMSIGSRLSLAVAEENGLAFLFLAFEELGGEGFWNNYSVLARVATLLATCPKSKKPKEYFTGTTKQFLNLMVNAQWAKRLPMLFSLFVDEGAKRFRGILDVLFLDRILSPFERLAASEVGFEKTEDCGFWSAKLDEALNLMHTWLSTLPRVTEVPYVNRLQKVFLTLAVMYESAPPETLIKQHLQVILRRIVRASGSPESQAECLLQQAVLAAQENRILIVEAKKKKMVEEVGEEAKEPKLLYDVFLGVADDEDALRARISAILALLETFPKVEKRKLVMELLRKSVKRWRAIDDRNAAASRFLALEGHSEMEKMTVQYIMGAVVEIYLTEDDALDGDSMLCVVDVCDVILLGMCSKLADRFAQKRAMDIVKAPEAEEVAVETKSLELAIGVIGGVLIAANADPELMNRLQRMTSTMKRFTRIVEANAAHCSQDLRLLSGSVGKLIEAMGGVNEAKSEESPASDIQKPTTSSADELETCLQDLEDPAEAIRGHSLIMLARLMRQRTPQADRMDPALIFDKIMAQLNDADSYVYLAAVGALAELAFWQREPYLGRLVEVFAEEREGDENLMLRCKLGEALGKVFRQLGDFAPLYFTRMVGVLLKMTSKGDELVKASALSGLADLIVACRGRRFDSEINELIYCINRLLTVEKSSLVRRASVNLLRSIIASCHYNIFETLPDHLRDIRRSLCALWKSDRDEVVRLHAELALIEIKEALATHVKSNEDSYVRQIRIV